MNRASNPILKSAAIILLALGGAVLPPATPIGHAQMPLGTAGSPAHAQPEVMYAAENAYLTGGAVVAQAHAGYQGSGYAAGLAKPGAGAIFAIGIPSDGDYDVTLRYANGSGSTRSLEIYANGLEVRQTALPPTATWSTWAGKTESLPLRAGLNTLAYISGGTGGDVGLDGIGVAGGSSLAPRGATVPYVEYEAETAATNGKIVGPDRAFTDLPSEASGRRAVTLSRRGQYVEFTLLRPANGMILRYSLPDSPKGTGITAPLSLYIDGHFRRTLTLTSKYTWLYGSYPFTNNPAGLGGHHFYDEVHTLFRSTLPAGAKVRVQVDAAGKVPPYTIDLADFEQVPAPYRQPAGYLSAASFGADPTGARDATRVLQQAVAAAEARHEGLYIPAGTYTVTGHLILDNVTIRGAGPWYTVLHGQGVGLYGDDAPKPSSHVGIYDLAIQGETTDRNDRAQVNGIGGAIGGGSVIQNVWIEHTKVGMWFDGPFDGLLIVGCRLRDLTADGLNLHDGISHVTVEQTQVRNTGDDGLAMWSDNDPDSYDVFRFDTVQLPYLANNFAMYGGHQNSITDDYGSDTLTQGGGINVGNRDYGSAVVPLSGTIDISRDTLVRTGQVDPNWGYGVGAIWLYAQTADMTAHIDVFDDEIDESTQEAIQFIGNSSISHVTFSRIHVDTATFAFQVQADVSAAIDHVRATNLGVAGIYNCVNIFKVTPGPGNAGWGKTLQCANLGEIAAWTPTAAAHAGS